ncbi:MAG: hypothetical protein [Bacteriophage sp.]|nr:MAG: hypothetical protein [Bacteriophage sp.]
MPDAEKELETVTSEIEAGIKAALVKHNISQAELSYLINENRPQITQAIKGYPGKRFVLIRKKIYQELNMN